METALKKMGNATFVVVPEPILQEIGAALGDKFELRLANGRIILEPVRQAAQDELASKGK